MQSGQAVAKVRIFEIIFEIDQREQCLVKCLQNTVANKGAKVRWIEMGAATARSAIQRCKCQSCELRKR